MNRRFGRITFGYVSVLTAAFLIAVIAGWTPLAQAVDGNAYDWMFRLHPPGASAAPASVVIAIDELTLTATQGMRNVRATLARGLNALAPLKPSAVAIDLILSDPDPAHDSSLAQALAASHNVVLASDLMPAGARWEDPLPEFRAKASAVGHVHAEPDPVSRVLPLEKAAGHDRRWAVAVEALRLVKSAKYVEESPGELTIGEIRIPVDRQIQRSIRIRYRAGGVPVVPLHSLVEQPQQYAALISGRTVFIGVTALTAARDRLYTPFQQTMSGVEIHANAFETLAGGRFLTQMSSLNVILLCLAIVVAAGAVFAWLSGYLAYGLGVLLVLAAHAIPHLAFAQEVVAPYLSPVLAAWLAVVSAAAWQYFFVRRQLRKSEADKARYQQAIHFVTHEMRSPLTAIQGSSELMGRYNLSDDKRKQMAQMINSESKRLARMIQTFLDIERLTDGHMEIRSEPFSIPDVIASCVERARVLAERKQIQLVPDRIDSVSIKGDRELMEYAVYNLLTNAVKYSPADTVTTVRATHDTHGLRLSVADQGIGMDEKELKNIFRKFYRTRKAEASGEAGTGIGLSIVEQIVVHHGGRMEVTSTPGKGSCFTMVLPSGVISASTPAPSLVSD